ncbi:small nuclear ribonucleoprotein SmB [Penicillium capsulatum]|uniref:Sm protein B n=1 Tax=Penicillium capsulatum TaxID=69766 RepID=A0A9W9LID5_9EURO|nr:small nuclear ribonucleoprotein SmB [Penicillium capsulatum]
MAANKQGKMINYRMRVTLNDGRQMTGQMLAFDKHMNLVLADTEEFRRTKRKSKPAPGASGSSQIEAEEKRTLGLTIVRGTQVVSCSVDGPPPADPSARLGTAGPGAGTAATLAAGPGISKPAGRGLPIGLGGPAAGVVSPVSHRVVFLVPLLQALAVVEDPQVDLLASLPLLVLLPKVLPRASNPLLVSNPRVKVEDTRRRASVADDQMERDSTLSIISNLFSSGEYDTDSFEPGWAPKPSFSAETARVQA